MELFYNPHLMPAGEIKRTFVARQWLVDEILELTQRQPEGAGVQHVVVIGPRGMGKTTLLLVVGLSMEERAIRGWQPVRLREEAYSVTDLADFWLEVLQHLSAETHDMGLLARADQLKREQQSADELQAAAFALIKDWSAQHAKRVVLLVDNFDMILAQINEERDSARLRNVLMNDGTLMFVGAATSYFREARAYDQPLYNFFKIYNLESLKSAEIEELLRRRAALDGQLDFERTLRENASRLRVLEYFTGGNPRLTLMLYRVVTGAGLAEVRSGLEKLLDEVTPYFKGKIESLPAQQRKILDHIARLSASTREGLTPGAIAEATRLSPNQVSAQLKRLAEEGYVRAANLRGRRSFYALSEPLLAVWCQMRFGRDARERIQWLIDFLRSFYDIQEICGESERLEARFRELISRGLKNEAQETLEYRRYLAEAMSEPAARSRHLDSILRGFLELRDVKKIKEIVADRALVSVSWETVKVAHRMGCLEELLAWADQMVSNQPGDWPILVNRSILLNLLKRHAEALAQLDEVLETHPAAAAAWILRGMTLRDLGRPEEAVRSVDTGLEHEPDDANAWLMRGELLLHLKRLAEAIVSADRALGIEARSARAFELRGNALLGLGRSGEALDSLDAALKCGAESIVSVQALRFLAGFALGRLDIAQQAWRDMVKALPKKEALSSFLLIFADVADPSFLRQLIREADLDEPLFPLARALEYVLTGDEALIEKLSPEVRGIVEQLVAKLRASGKPLPAKLPAQPRKRRKISRRASRHL